MAIDPGALLRFPIPEVQQSLTPRDCAFYALSVGLGQDPTDARQLDYVDPRRALQALPTMAVVLAQPGFWLADPRTGVDAVRLVHGEQTIELHEPLPTHGTILGQTRVAGLVDRGAGRPALLYVEKQVSCDGRPIATCRATVVLRGDGGFGGPAGPIHPVPPAPGGTPDMVVDLPTRPEQALIYRLNGDDNPLHSDPAVAAAAGFARPILHGLCTLGVVGHALLRGLAGYDARRIRSMALRFSAPVFPGETIRTEMWRSGAFRARVLERDAVVVNNGQVMMR